MYTSTLNTEMRKPKRRFNQKILLLVIGAISVFVTVSTVAQSVKLAYGYTVGGSEVQQLVSEHIANFQQENPDIQVELIWPLSDDGLVVMFAAGQAPDVVMITSGVMIDFVAADLLQPLDRFFESDPAVSPNDYWPAAIYRVGGRIYGILDRTNPWVLFYNGTYFSEAGIPDPAQRYRNGDWTWDEFADAARKLVRRTDADQVAVYGTMSILAHTVFPGFVWSNGGDYFSEDGTRTLLGDSEAIEVFEWVENSLLSAPGTMYPSYGYSRMHDMALAGQLGMWISAHGAIVRYADRMPYDWDLSLPPKAKDYAVLVEGPAHAMSMTTNHPDAAWRFLVHMAGEEVHLENTRAGLGSSRRSIGTSPLYLKRTEPPFNNDIAWVAALGQYGRLEPRHEKMTSIKRILSDAWSRLIRREQSARVIAESLKQRINAILIELNPLSPQQLYQWYRQ
jgi:multiple sugar transport system substrate-binding protein